MGEATGQKLRSMLGDAAYVALGSYGTQALSFLINVVLVRKLDLDNYGAYSVFLTVYSMSTLVMSLGAAPIVLRYLPELIARGNRGGVIRLKRLGAGLHLGAGLVIIAFCWLFKDALATWLNAPMFAGLLPYFALFTLLQFEASIFEQMLVAHRSQKFRNLTLMGTQLLKLLLFWLALPQDGSAATVLQFLVLSNGILFLLMAARALGLTRAVPDSVDEPLPWRRLTRYGLLQYTNVMAASGFLSDIDLALIAHYLGAVETGFYRYATTTVYTLCRIVPMHFLLSVLVPVYVADYTRNKDPEQLKRVFSFYNKVVNGFLAPAFVGTLVLAVPITALIFDPKMLPAVPALRVFFVGMYITYFLNTTSFLLTILERPEITLYSRVFVIYNLVMDVVLIPRFGIMGAAIATSTAIAMGYVFTYFMVKRVIAIRIPWGATLRTFAYCGAMALVVWLPLRAGWITNVPRLILVVGAGSLVYGLLAWRLPVFTQDERQHLNAALRRRVFPT